MDPSLGGYYYKKGSVSSNSMSWSALELCPSTIASKNPWANLLIVCIMLDTPVLRADLQDLAGDQVLDDLGQQLDNICLHYVGYPCAEG